MKLFTLRVLALVALFTALVFGYTHGVLAGFIVATAQSAALMHLANAGGLLCLTRQTLPVETAAKTGFTELIIVTFADLTAAANTQTIDLLTLRVGDLFLRSATKLVTAFDFSDATLISLAATLGDSSSATRFLASQELAVDGTEITFKAGTGTHQAYPAADTLKLALTGTAAKLLNTATVGELHILVGIVHLNEIGRAIN